MKKVLIFGNGQIANFYLEHWRDSDYDASVAEADIRHIEEVQQAVESAQPDIIINTAAKTNLEWCGLHRLESFAVNVLGAANIARVADEKNIYFIHYSSGCIYSSVSGKDAKVETDLPNPDSYYGWTKVWAEEMIGFERSDNFKCLILRPRQPVSAQVNHKNMLVKMLTFSKFIDTPNSGTVIEDLMDWTDQLIEKDATGIYHVANTGWTTPYDIGLLIKKHILPDLEPEKISKAELDKLTPNKRVDTVLDVTKLQEFGVTANPYKERLEEIVIELGKNLKSLDKAEVQKVLEQTAEASRQRTVVNNVFESLYK